VRVTTHGSNLFEKAGELSDAYGPVLGARTLDVLHVAAALHLGVSEFYSFDRRQCALAARCSLVVKPG
jgi:predicted nucleic acid-binding protein